MEDAVARHPGSRPVWHDLLTDDPEASEAFYTAVFGWSWEAREGYRVAKVGDQLVAGLSPFDAEGAAPHWLVHMAVDDAQTSARRLQFLQGEVLLDPEQPGDPAIVVDPQGAVFAMLAAEPAEIDDPPVGTFAWHELLAPRADLGARIYKTLLDWKPASPVYGPGGQVVVMKSRRKPVAALREGLDDDVSTWVPFVRVASLAEAVAGGETAGARVLAAALDLPGIEARGAIFADPRGAPVGVLEMP
jgi:predicted enzyme related to lactoylglutathione lyase